MTQQFLRSRRLRGLLLPVLLLLLWESMAHRDAAHAYAFASLESILSSLRELLANGQLLGNFLASLRRTAIGLSVGATAGIAIGALMAASTTAMRLIGPLYQMLRQVPLLGLIPLICLWFGTGEFSKVLVVVLAAFYPVALNTFEGLRQIDAKYREVGQVFMLRRDQMLFQILLPAALPGIFTGLSQAIPFAWITATGSELFFTSGAGLGGLMLNAESGARIDIIVVCIATIAAAGTAMNWLFGRLSRRLLSWREAG